MKSVQTGFVSISQMVGEDDREIIKKLNTQLAEKQEAFASLPDHVYNNDLQITNQQVVVIPASTHSASNPKIVHYIFFSHSFTIKNEK